MATLLPMPPLSMALILNTRPTAMEAPQLRSAVGCSIPTGTTSPYLNYAPPQAAYAAYSGGMTYYPQPGQQQHQGAQPPYGAPAYGYPAPNGSAPYAGAPGAYPPPPPGNVYPIPPPQHGLPSPQGAPPYKRTRYEGGPVPPLPPGPAPPPPALPPVGGSSSRGGPPPPRGQYDRGPPPPSAHRGPPPFSRYDDRFDGPPPPGPYRDDPRDRLPPPPPGHYDRGDRYGPPPPSRYDDRRPPPPSLRRDERLPPPPGPAYRDQGSPGPRGGAPRGPAFAPRDGPSRPPRGGVGRSGGGAGGGGGGRPVSALPGAGRAGFVSSPAKRGDRFAAVDAPRGPRNARVNAIPPHGQKKERKWGARTMGSGGGPGGSGKEKSGDGRTLTDFRIAGLEITELKWTWAAKAQALVKALVEAGAAKSTEKENGDGVKGTTKDDATAPMKKKTKSQRKAERRRAAKAAAAVVEEPTSNAGLNPEDESAQEDGDDEVDGEPVSTSLSPSQKNTKKSKHMRDEDEDSESRGEGDVDATMPKKVKADTGEVVKLESVEPKPEVEAEAEAAESSLAAQEDVDGEPVEVKEEEENKSADADATEPEEPVAAPTPVAASNPPPFKLSAANSAPPANAPTGPAAERPPSDRENSRLRIYFSSPVDSVSTYINPGGNGSVRGATVELQASTRDTSMAPPTIEEEVAPANDEAVVEEAVKPEGVSGGAETTAEAPANDEAEVDGDDVHSLPLEGGPLGNTAETTEPAAAVQASVEPDVTAAAASQDEAVEVNADTDAGDVSMSSVYPPDPYAQGQPSITGSTHGDETEDKPRESSVVPGTNLLPHLTPPEPSADRISISYARNTRRMVLDAEVVESVKIFRAEGRIELGVLLRPAYMGDGEDAVPDEFRVCQGILIEALDREHDDYLVIDRLSLEAAWRTRAANDETKDTTEEAKEGETEDPELDPLLPPLHHLLATSLSDETGATALSVAPGFTRDRITVIARFDRSNPLTEARWVKTGEIDQWITGLALEKKDDKLSAWKGKIVVHDPEPPPTIQDALDAWTSSSSIGSLADRKAFVSGHMSDIDNVLEILLRLARGDTRSHYNTNHSSSTGPSVPVLAASLSAPYPDSQTQVSLAVLAMFRLSVQTAEKAGLDTQEVHRQVSEIVKGVPHHMQFKALDGMFVEYRKKNKAIAPTILAPAKAKEAEVSAQPAQASMPAPAPAPPATDVPAKETPAVEKGAPVVAKE
ncbi:BQ5605_C016g08195 [Microbotryum silenes-dioicae]|uniref:BQ5605_C016g08195 protein n=1 Tax=Microbotryum silenes-dioicae TaxID=796604 RepID=A0A2X0LVH4_9BASI|nr:BQ5605_C016g08195 [Microbotryum silenes-dioicae]